MSCPGAQTHARGGIGRRVARLARMSGVAFVASILNAGCWLFGGSDEEPTPVEITPENRAPVALALGPPGLVPAGTAASFDGSASFDYDGDVLTFLWEWVSRPDRSGADLTGSTTSVATFTPDVGGEYVVRLTVSDGQATGTAQASALTLGISAISPDAGPAGTEVMISGGYFLAPQTVTFNGTPATVVRSTTSEIVVEAPAGGTTGPIAVSIGSVSVTGPTYFYGAPPACSVAGDEPVADAYVRGGSFSDTSFGGSGSLFMKGINSLEFARKIYLVFDVSGIPASFGSVALRLRVSGHSADAPRDASLWGVTDDDDWDPSVLAEDDLTWNTAPRNDLASGIGFTGQGTTAADGVRLLGTVNLDNADAPGTTYDLDITEYVTWAVGDDATFSSAAPAGDSDGLITLLFAHSAMISGIDGSVFYSREEAEVCRRPQLVVR